MVIDLSVVLNEQTPIYPGDPAVKIVQAGIFVKDGYADHHISMGNHVGTHIDAPMHMLENGKSLDQISVDQFVGRGRLVEVSTGNFDDVKSAGIEEGDIVLFRTGMSDKYHEPVYFEDYPIMSEEVAKFLVAVKVKMIGLDACSVDNKDSFPIHKILLGGNVLIIENLSNLTLLHGKEFSVYALPLKLQVDGAPARVVAQLMVKS